MLDSTLTPRIKPIYPVYRVDDARFRIGAQLGITAEIKDPTGQIWALAQLLDGTRTVGDIVGAMRARFPTLSAQDVEEGIRTLDTEGFIEDARPTAYDALVDGQESRYAGNINYFSHFAGLAGDRAAPQDALRSAKVVLLGLGGAGSNLLPLLLACGFGEVLAVDYDRVELSNLNRQFLYREQDIGRYKTEAAESIVAALNSSVRFSTLTMKVTSAEALRPVVRGATLVLCAIDEPPFQAQRRVNYACIKEGVACVYALSQVTSGRVFSILPERSGCFDCLNIHYSKHDAAFVQQFRGFHETNFDAPTLAFAPNLMRLCGVAVAEAVRIVTGYTPPQSIGVQLELGFESGEQTPLTTWPRYPSECPTCGTGREEDWPIFALYPEPL